MSPRRKIEILSNKGWSSAGSYTEPRASVVADLLRGAGAIVRMEGESPVRPRISWSAEMGSGAWIGRINGIDLFGTIPTRMSEFLLPEPGSKWALYSLLPGKDTPNMVFETMADAEDAAERLLDRFIWDIGVRAMSVDDYATTDTAVIPVVSVHDNTDVTVQTVPGGVPVATLVMDAIEGSEDEPN